MDEVQFVKALIRGVKSKHRLDDEKLLAIRQEALDRLSNREGQPQEGAVSSRSSNGDYGSSDRKPRQ